MWENQVFSFWKMISKWWLFHIYVSFTGGQPKLTIVLSRYSIWQSESSEVPVIETRITNPAGRWCGCAQHTVEDGTRHEQTAPEQGAKELYSYTSKPGSCEGNELEVSHEMLVGALEHERYDIFMFFQFSIQLGMVGQPDLKSTVIILSPVKSPSMEIHIFLTVTFS